MFKSCSCPRDEAWTEKEVRDDSTYESFRYTSLSRSTVDRGGLMFKCIRTFGNSVSWVARALPDIPDINSER